MALLDPSGKPFPPNLQGNAFEVRIDENGNPTRLNGDSILGESPLNAPRADSAGAGLPSSERMDAFIGNTGNQGGLNGYGYPGYRGATFQNGATGIGTQRDKTTWGNYWAPWRIMDSELLAMYNGSDLAAKIVEAAPQEMFRRGWEVRSRDIDDDEIKALDKKSASLRLNELLLEGSIWGRLFGGSMVIMGAEDGRNPDEELNEDSIKTFHYLNVVDRRFVWVQRYYSDMLSPKFGLPEIYLITNIVSHGGMYGTTNPPPGIRLAAVSIHESRCIRFDGAKTDVLTRQQLAGWTWSVLQRCYDVLRRFDGAFDSTGNLLSDASQAVFKIKNLMEMIAQNQKDKLLARMQLVDFGRSVMRGIMVDADSEEFKREPTSFAGIPDILDRYMMRLAAAANMPVTRLFGRAPAGMNATGESDTRMWLDQIRSMQENELAPKIKCLYQLLSKAKDSGIKEKDVEFQVEFRPLFEPTETESADRGLKLAQRNQILIDEGVITPEQAALGMFGSGKLSDWVDVDVDALQKAVTGAVKFDPYAAEPTPTGSLVNAAQQGEMQSPVVPLPLPGAPDLNGSERQKEAESPQRTTEKPLLAINAQTAKTAPGGKPLPLESKSTQVAPDKDEDGNPIPRKAKQDHYDKPGAPIRADHVALQPIHDRRADNSGRPRDARYDSDAIAAGVHHQLAEDFPEDKLGWVLAASWKGPIRVPLDKIDFSGQSRWQAAHDPVKVGVMKDRIESGIEKPVILVRVPHSNLLKVVDGHHRTTSYQELGRNVKAYIGKVNATNGPWDELHSTQKEGGFEGSTQKEEIEK
jgi:phage-related protein (TIGR01555 family)